ncbi:hypothetical protein DASC09_014550 [Saccharomycopsis crataegensis]|uniref:DASH complex subunit DAD4 n=1 Tax=Saccharomycopsis crataegensis TaxID=43959 RepID=A0AAV5QIB7_9ASCO|nr:hypothetical protein DASC09_014550 [Saccharomycopsis crataegensis]
MNNPNDEVHANKLSAIVGSLEKLNQSVSTVNKLLEEIVQENHETEIISEIWEHYDKGAELMLRSQKLSQQYQKK